MTRGKVKDTICLLSETQRGGLVKLTDIVNRSESEKSFLDILHEKHPKSQPPSPEALVTPTYSDHFPDTVFHAPLPHLHITQRGKRMLYVLQLLLHTFSSSLFPQLPRQQTLYGVHERGRQCLQHEHQSTPLSVVANTSHTQVCYKCCDCSSIICLSHYWLSYYIFVG